MAEPLHSSDVTSAQDNSRQRPDVGVIAGYLRELRRHDRGRPRRFSRREPAAERDRGAQSVSRLSASSGSAG